MNATTDADSQRELEAFFEYYAATRTFNYADLAVFVVLLFEFVITFDREVHFAWGHKLSWARTIFLLNRYLSILEYLVVLGPLLPTYTYLRQVHNVVSTMPSLIIHVPSSCLLLTRLMQAFQIVLYIVWAGFAGWRVYAISARNVVLTMAVIGLAVVPAATNAYVTTRTIVALSELGCMSWMDLPVLTWIEFVPMSAATRSCMIFSDALVIVVTWVKTWSTIRAARKLHVQMSFTSLILREGILYFAIMLSLNVIQIVFDFSEVGSYGFIVPFLNVMTPVLISRFFLDLDDLRTQEAPGRPSSSASGARSLEAQSTMRFITPRSTAPDEMPSALEHGSDYIVNDFGGALPEKGYPASATW